MSEQDPRPIVAETMRVVAFWVADEADRDPILDAAKKVEWMQRDDACCALCEEVTCDEDCPMETWRIQGRPTTNPQQPELRERQEDA
ncbi:MAG: hypothetical protein ACXVXP_00200 [Mycobacteriaceae bacterium]